MKKVLFVICIFLLSGCDHFPRHQYDIGAASKSLASQICNDLDTLALKHSLVRRSAKRDAMLCYYSESEQNNIVLGARLLEEKIVIDIQGFNHRREIASLKEETEKIISLKFPNAKHSGKQ